MPMKKNRSLGHVSWTHAMAHAVVTYIDENNVTGSVVTSVFEQRLDDLEDSNVGILSSISNLSSSVSSSVSSIDSSILDIYNDVASLSVSYAALSQSLSLLSASVASGSGGGLTVNIDDDAELWFDGNTLLTNADVYISGSGNNLYLHGTNDQGMPAKFQFSVRDGGTYIEEVPHTDFGPSVSDPWFMFDGDTLLTHADIYVSGTNNFLYLNGTDENGDYGIFYFDIVNGQVIIKQTGSV